jgi:hypothetical protein
MCTCSSTLVHYKQRLAGKDTSGQAREERAASVCRYTGTPQATFEV